jgi:hypothetical protein
VAELTGTGAPKGIDAKSFAAYAKNPEHAGPAAAYSEYDLGAGVPQYMIRTRRYKYIYNDGQTDELYDWEAEPGEFMNRGLVQAGAKSVPAVVSQRTFAICASGSKESSRSWETSVISGPYSRISRRHLRRIVPAPIRAARGASHRARAAPVW